MHLEFFPIKTAGQSARRALGRVSDVPSGTSRAWSGSRGSSRTGHEATSCTAAATQGYCCGMARSRAFDGYRLTTRPAISKIKPRCWRRRRRRRRTALPWLFRRGKTERRRGKCAGWWAHSSTFPTRRVGSRGVVFDGAVGVQRRMLGATSSSPVQSGG